MVRKIKNPIRYESKPTIRRKVKEFSCPIELVFSEIGGKWKGAIIFQLSGGVLRFSDLRKKISKITPRMLARQLRELEMSGLIFRDVYPEMPPRVEYGLTEFGASLKPVMSTMARWGKENGWRPSERM